MKTGGMLTLVGALALVSGCTTPLMKPTPFYTGSQTVFKEGIERRVNLWPLAYHRDPAPVAL